MSEIDPQPAATDLTHLLARIATDPGRTDDLHRLLGWYCHESRNILNSLKMSFYLLKRLGGVDVDARWRELRTRYEQVERFIDRLHQFCRPMPLYPLRVPLDLLFEEKRDAWARQLEAAGHRLVLDPPAQAAVGSFDPNRFGPAFDDLVDWRSRHGAAGSDLCVAWAAETEGEASALVVCWTERAPLEARASGPASSVRAEAKPEADAISALCLPLLTGIVTLHGGTVETNEGQGWRLRMRWPTPPSTNRGDTRPC